MPRIIRRVVTGVAALAATLSKAEAQEDFKRCQQTPAPALAQQAARGVAEAEFCLGFFYATGRSGYDKNVPEGIRHFRAAADKGFAPAQAYLGYFYKHGEGVKQDFSEAARWYRKAADQGHAGAETDLGLLYLEGNGVPKNQDEAVKWLRKAALLGSGQAASALAALERGGGPATAKAEPATDQFEQGRRLYAAGNKTGAFQPFLAAANAGNTMAQVQVGYQLEFGEGVAANPGEAARWYAKAANLGNAQAACNLGHLYESGIGVGEDWVKAAEWYRKSADQHNRRCEGSMARAYRFGVGVPQNRGQAVSWYNRAGSGQGSDPESAYWANWLSVGTNNIGFRDQREHDTVIGGKLRWGLLAGDPSGMSFHNSAERIRWLIGQRHEVDLREARTMWQIGKDQYENCRRSGGPSCIDPGAEPR